MTRDDQARAWCPYCREHHYDESWEAAVDFVNQICKPEHEEEE